MKVFLNDNAFQMDMGSNLLELLQEKKLSTKQGIAVAINNKIIVRNKWASTKLNDMDKIYGEFGA